MKKINSLQFVIILLLGCAMFNYSEAQLSQIVYSTIVTHIILLILQKFPKKLLCMDEEPEGQEPVPCHDTIVLNVVTGCKKIIPWPVIYKRYKNLHSIEPVCMHSQICSRMLKRNKK